MMKASFASDSASIAAPPRPTPWHWMTEVPAFVQSPEARCFIARLGPNGVPLGTEARAG
jgi:hypothetical protein